MPFAAAIRVMFASAVAGDATYTPANGDPVAIRVIRSQPDQVVDWNSHALATATTVFTVQHRQVPDPRPGDLITLSNGAVHAVQSRKSDALGLTWELAMEPAE